MKSPLFILLLLVIMAGCSTTQKHASLPIETRVLQQQQWLTSLRSGQAIDQVLAPVLAYQKYSFETKSDTQLYQYVEGKYPGTNMLFGLYFVDTSLMALILDQQVVDFALCRSYGNKGGLHWLDAKGIETSGFWLVQQNRLASEFNIEIVHPNRNIDHSMSGSDMLEAGTYLPIIAVALPFYLIDRVAGGMQLDAKKAKEQIHLQDAVQKIKLGMTKDQLLRTLGSPNQKRSAADTTIWIYRSLAMSFGVHEGLIVWKESLFTGIPSNSSTNSIGADCY